MSRSDDSTGPTGSGQAGLVIKEGLHECSFAVRRSHRALVRGVHRHHPPTAVRVAACLIVQPSSTITGAVISPPVNVAVQDASGHTATTAIVAVTVALASNTQGATLAGTTTVNAVNGIATFSNLSIQQVSTGYTLTASAGPLTGATSRPFDIMVPPPTQLAFTVSPGNVTAGAPITPSLQVSIKDATGAIVTTATNTVSLTLGGTVSGATLAGTTTVSAVNGVATFSDLVIQKAGTGYTLAAAASSLRSASSPPFAVAPAAPAKLTFAAPPSTSDTTRPITPAVQVAIQDAFANTVTSATNAVTLSLGANPGGATLAGTLTMPAANGIASFGNLKLDRPGSGYTLTAASGTLTAATSPPFNVVKTEVIAFVSEDQGRNHVGIATMRSDGSSVAALRPTGEGPVWSPDGKKLAFVAGGDVFVMNADGTGAVDILHGDVGSNVVGLAWKPDGLSLAFGGAYNYASGLFVMGADGSSVTRVLGGYGFGHPSWSPDGSRIAFECSTPTGNADICLVNSNGSGFAQVTSDPDAEYQPAWKPDGTRILFVANGSGFSGLKVINPDGTGMTPLLSYGNAYLPAWSGDGQHIAFVAEGGCISYSYSYSYSYCSGVAPDSIVVANADGSGVQVVNQAATEPAWRP